MVSYNVWIKYTTRNTRVEHSNNKVKQILQIYFGCQKTIMETKIIMKLVLTLVDDEVCMAAGKSPKSKQALS